MFGSPNDIQTVDDSCNLIFPWYTKNALEKLKTIIGPETTVFEWGGGASTVWYAYNAKHVDTLESNNTWANDVKKYLDGHEKTNYTMCSIETPLSARENHPNKDEYLAYITTLGKKWDVIAIDGSYRQDALDISVEYLNPGGVLIFDNWLQDTSGYPDLANKDKFLAYEHDIFGHPGRPEWHTAFFYF
jgi:predicted O-methyltransferase YrrM